jgi:LacI family repressor for deo operon, udp, cdd, tsx, nupC, and nupG
MKHVKSFGAATAVRYGRAMASIRDVATSAGVSTTTVSRVLLRPELVQPSTREEVLRVIKELGYAPNPAASALRTTRTGKLIVTVPDISNPFFANVIRGVEEEAQANGLAVLLGDTRGSRERENQYADMLQRREADGLIFLGHRLPDALEQRIAREGAMAPIVNGCEFSPSLGVSSAHIDNAAAARQGMNALYDVGHERIAVITGPLDSPISRDRLVGAKLAAERRGLIGSMTIATGPFSLHSGQKIAASLLLGHPRPTAIFCFSDEIAIGAMSALRRHGLDCPADVSVLGFDDIPMAAYASPPLTTIRQPMREIGLETVRLLIETIEGRIQTVRSVTLPHRMIVRQSVSAPK